MSKKLRKNKKSKVKKKEDLLFYKILKMKYGFYNKSFLTNYFIKIEQENYMNDWVLL